MRLDPRSALARPKVFRLFNRLVTSGRSWRVFIDDHLRPGSGDRVLDIGCGVGDVLEYLSDVDYHGFDGSAEYIETARKTYGDRGNFECALISKFNLGELEGSFERVIASGILHHLDDDEAITLLETAQAALVPGGRLVTLDGCYTDGQGPVSRWLLSLDRGDHVRRDFEYVDLIERVFDDVDFTVYDDLLRIPYAHIIVAAS